MHSGAFLYSFRLLCEGLTRSPAVARDGQLYWPSRKTVIPSGIGLVAVLGVDNACLLTCDMSRSSCAVIWTQVTTISDVGFHAT